MEDFTFLQKLSFSTPKEVKKQLKKQVNYLLKNPTEE